VSTTKPPTPQGISALLRKADHVRAEYTGGGRTGHRSHSEGFVVRSEPPAGVKVMHVFGSFAQHNDHRRAWRHKQYAAVIRNAGYAVEDEQGHLIVTARTEGEG
jgi:hypothetical protein